MWCCAACVALVAQFMNVVRQRNLKSPTWVDPWIICILLTWLHSGSGALWVQEDVCVTNYSNHPHKVTSQFCAP